MPRVQRVRHPPRKIPRMPQLRLTEVLKTDIGNAPEEN